MPILCGTYGRAFRCSWTTASHAERGAEFPACPAWTSTPPHARISEMLEDDRFPTPEEIEETVTQALRQYGFAPAENLLKPSLDGTPHPFASAGPKLSHLREQSGWTISEIAERTGSAPRCLDRLRRWRRRRCCQADPVRPRTPCLCLLQLSRGPFGTRSPLHAVLF